MQTTSQPRRRRRATSKGEAAAPPAAPESPSTVAGSADPRQLGLPYVPPAPITAALHLVDRVVDLDLRVGGGALPVDLPLALTKGARVLRDVEVVRKGAAPSMEIGMQTPDLREYFVGASDVGVAGVLLLRRKEDGWAAALSKTLLPYVLTGPAVKAGEMPPPGQSALPKSLERVVPKKFRYWEAPTPESAKAARDALVEAGMFDERLLKLVDGQIRLCVEQLYLYEPEEEPAAKTLGGAAPLAEAVAALLPSDKTPVSPFDAAAEASPGGWEAALAKVARDPANVLVLSPPLPTVKPVVDALIKAAPAAAWLVEYDAAHDPAAGAELARLGPVFKVAGLDSHVFASSFLPSARVTWVESPPLTPSPAATPRAAEAAPLSDTVVKRFAHVRKDGAEERYVLGIVLEPEVVDAQSDIYSAAEIAQSAHTFMEKFRTVGLMHKGSINDKVKILESYLAPVDFEVDGVPVKKGTWLMAVRVLDDDLWAAVKEGGLTGFSIGGSAVRKPEEPAAPAPAAN